MIDLYYWTTPNGHKITIFLEETGLPYKIFPINIGKGEQFAKDFLKISPNNRIPAMVDHEPRGRRRAAGDVRVGRDAALSRRQDEEVHCAGSARTHRDDRMAVLADGQSRAELRTEQSLQQLRAGQDPVRDGPLSQRGEPALRRAQQAACRARIHRGRVFHRRHGELSVDRAARAAGPEHCRLPAHQALARRHQGAARGRARLRQGEGDQSERGRHPHRGRARDPVRADRGVGQRGGADPVSFRIATQNRLAPLLARAGEVAAAGEAAGGGEARNSPAWHRGSRAASRARCCCCRRRSRSSGCRTGSRC